MTKGNDQCIKVKHVFKFCALFVESGEKGLFTVSPRLRQLLSYVYAGIVFSGLLMYYLANSLKSEDKDTKQPRKNGDNRQLKLH